MIEQIAKYANLLAKIFCGVSLLFIVLGAVFAVVRWNYLRTAVATTATIVDLIERDNDDGDPLYAPVYEFADQQGATVKATSSTARFPPIGEVGDQIDVYYDPANPKDSIEKQFFSVWGLPALFAGLGAFYLIVSAAVAYFTGRRIRGYNDRLPGANVTAATQSESYFR